MENINIEVTTESLKISIKTVLMPYTIEIKKEKILNLIKEVCEKWNLNMDMKR